MFSFHPRQRVRPLEHGVVAIERGLVGDDRRDGGNASTAVEWNRDSAIAIDRPLVNVAADVEILAIALDAEDKVVDEPRGDGPIHAIRCDVSRDLRRIVPLVGRARIIRSAAAEVRVAQIPTAVPGDCGCDLIIDARCGIQVTRFALMLPLHRLHKRSGRARQISRRILAALVHFTEDALDGGIDRGGEARGACCRQQIRPVNEPVRPDVSENARL